MYDEEDRSTPAETKLKIDDLLPPGYPKYVFHGTSEGNYIQIDQFGPALGTFTSNLFISANRRYSREDGCILVCPYSDFEFHNAGPNEVSPNLYYTIKAIQPKKIKFSYNHRDPDGVPYEDKICETNIYITPDKISAFRINSEQQAYLRLIADLLSGDHVRNTDWRKMRMIEELVVRYKLNKPEVKNPVDTLFFSGLIGGDDNAILEWDVYQNQKLAAKCLGLNPEDFQTNESLRVALAPHCSDEASFVEYALKNFPGKVEWLSHHFDISDKDLLSQIIVQFHQFYIICATEALLAGGEINCNPLYPDSKNMQKLNELLKRQVKQPPVVGLETKPEEPEIVFTPKTDGKFILD